MSKRMKMEPGNKEALAPPRGEMATVSFCPVLACAAVLLVAYGDGV